MASIVKDPGGRKRILFVGIDGVRRAVRLGKCSMRDAEEFTRKVEALIAARMQGCVINAETARWVADLPEPMHAKLAIVGLVDARIKRTAAALLSVADLCDQYIGERDDVKKSTATVYALTRRNLVDFFGHGKPIGEITAHDGELWRRDLARRGLSEATARKRVSVAKQILSTAVKRRIIPENPFAGLKSTAVANEARRYYVTREEAQKVLDACPDAEWRLIFALARFGGLRTPSETLALRWSDITGDRIVIHSPKTEHHEGKGERVIPLFPELRTPLDEVFQQAKPGTEHVITRYRLGNANLRTQLQRIIKRAGLKPWPKLFQNLRSTRQTELAEIYPLHVVVAWLGNSQLVAAKHYLQVTDEHYGRAIQAAQNPAQSTPTNSGKPRQADRGESDKTLDLQTLAGNCGSLPSAGMRLKGLEPLTFSSVG